MLNPDLITELQDLRYLIWSHTRRSSGTAGSYLKAYEIKNGKKLYYKLSCFDDEKGVTGHECVNELIADRLITILGIEHVHYQLIHALVEINGREYETYVCVSENFKEPGESKMALDDYFEIEHARGETALEFCKRMGWESYIYNMLIVDHLILNRDRHGANIELLLSPGSQTARPAPLFDHGLSLIFSCRTDEEAELFDPLADIDVQSFVGSRSADKNLSLIPDDRKPEIRSLEERDRAVIMKGLDDILSKSFLNKIWDIIWSRWCMYESM